MSKKTPFDPSPILFIGNSFLYQLDGHPTKPSNLWSGSLHPNNSYGPQYRDKAAKLFMAAEDMLAALNKLTEWMINTGVDTQTPEFAAAVDAIEKATKE